MAKVNPVMCTFGVRGGNFLGYRVSEKGTEANPKKIEAIIQMSSSKTIKDVKKLKGKVAYLARFISKSADKNLPFFKMLRKAKDFQRTSKCGQTLNDLKQYLTIPELLANPKVGETLYLYLAVSDDAVSSVLVREEVGQHKPVYYVRRMLQGTEKKYI
ncbi:UNVERIFIED_CONTAM: hypothetical protein Slati_2909000 [Sesamum latifolium]|uniref:Reverse transcriptase/retrotransposon-derived protein RNase H-like domain-containing protein n=1 Tax=Sesamum latifolium TaxID=2727402 RepID=A0AAW2VDQ8_9LAMI